jgi:hypothetical protein
MDEFPTCEFTLEDDTLHGMTVVDGAMYNLPVPGYWPGVRVTGETIIRSYLSSARPIGVVEWTHDSERYDIGALVGFVDKIQLVDKTIFFKGKILRDGVANFIKDQYGPKGRYASTMKLDTRDIRSVGVDVYFDGVFRVSNFFFQGEISE